MNRIAVAKALVKLAKSLVSEEQPSKVDQWLTDNGWKETHGIALYTNREYPLVGIDTNSGKASVSLFDSENKVFDTEGAMVDYTNSIPKLEAAVKKAQVLQELWTTLNSKYKSGYSKHFTPHIDFFGDSEDNVSFSIYADNFVVVVGGGPKFGYRKIRKQMQPSPDSIVKFIEDAQQEIKAGGGEKS